MEKGRQDSRALLLLLMAAVFLALARPGDGGRRSLTRAVSFRPVPADPADAAVMPLFRFGRIDVNTASMRTLMRIPGIGPARARAIIALRDRRGGFGSLEELAAIRGVGKGTVKKLGRWLAVRGQGTGDRKQRASLGRSR